MMAVRYSGQYAAAQLGKLPLPHSLQLEIAEYVGHHDLDLLLPPSYRALARMLGRLPTDDYSGNDDVRVRAFEYELSNHRGLVSARCMTRRGMRLASVVAFAPLEELRDRSGARLMLYDIYFNVEHTRDDFEFFRMWREQNNYEWPRTPRTNGSTVHDRLWRPVCKYSGFRGRHERHAASVSTIINRYNNAANVFRSFSSVDGTCNSSESDFDSD